jgi:two-component system cell cycle sensor histidine kinase/response regulator CckA
LLDDEFRNLIRNSGFIQIFREDSLKFRDKKRFSTYLVTTFVVLVALSVVVILATIYRYLGKKVESEFFEKLQAQKGQVEIILKNRLSLIAGKLDNLRSDNIIRVSLMLSVKSNLEDRITQFYPPQDGVYHFIKKMGEQSVVPGNYPGISSELIDFALTEYPNGEFLEDGDQNRVLWLFDLPIMHETGRMGTAYALYDMAQDTKLIEAIQQAVDAYISVFKAGQLFGLTSPETSPLDEKTRTALAINPGFHPLGQNRTLARLNGINNFYFQSSLESLVTEKRKITLWIGLFSVVILATSILMSIFVAKKMVGPLKDMTVKAIQISEGQKDLLFDDKGQTFWEFNQLSQAFNYMLTNLKGAEEQARYKELLENVDDAVYILDLDGNILEANEAAYLQLGYTADTFFKLNLAVIIPEKDARFIIGKLGPKDHSPIRKKISLETVHYKKDGDSVPVEIHSRVITYRGKNVILNVARNVSRRIEAQKALRESEERYRSVVENSRDGIMVLNDSFQIIYANNVLSQILGYPRKEIEGSYFKNYLTKDSFKPVEDFFINTFRGETTSSGLVGTVIQKTGSERPVKMIADRFEDSSGKVKLVGQLSDITDKLKAEREKKNLEAQLIHAQKMEAIGTLAGGIAHDFNNILMGIQGYLSLMRLSPETENPQEKYIQGIEENVMSAANLTEQLLGFARKGKYTPRTTRLNEVIEKSTRMFTRTRKDITVHKRLQEDIWKVKVDQGQIEQVLINLYLNAWHAMPDGGELYIQTEKVSLSDDYCKPYEVKGGKYVKISVTDNGIGMDKETLERIFEPFFTTKEIGKGTGLGLASAYGIIKNHNGIIRAYSEKGHGATFVIYLPASETQELEASPPESMLVRGTEGILLVDDEEGPILVEELMLKELGYTVSTARSGKEAIDLYKSKTSTIDLVALDMIMPEKSGRATYDELKTINPQIKVLLVSGYSLNKQVEELIARGCSGFIQKPFDILELSQKLRQILDA